MEDLDQHLDRYQQARGAIAARLEAFAERIGGDGDAGLALPDVAGNLRAAAATLRGGTFRLMLLGDMKRGKTTLLNALLGEALLPARVTPCTALITVVRYGETGDVTLHRRDGAPERVSLDEFRRCYVIPDQEAKAFEATGLQTFPEIDYAEVAAPVELLKKNVEFVDSPGLNDTEERNRITFGFLPRCHAVLFLLSATQPLARTEREYLEEHLAGRGYTVFFLVNFWNQLAETVLRQSDRPAQEEKLRRMLRDNLVPYCREGDRDQYAARVFEIDALGALRARLARRKAPKETGVPEFIAALDRFLVSDRGRNELRRAAAMAETALERVEEAARRRASVLREPVELLRQRIAATGPQFDELGRIRGRVADRIRAEGSRRAEAIAVDFESFLTDLHQSFEAEFPTFAPPVRMRDLFALERRREFEQAVNDSFRRYMAVKVDAWRQRSDRRLRLALASLGTEVAAHGRDYRAVVEQIDAAIRGDSGDEPAEADPDLLPAWTRYAAAASGLLSGEVQTTGVGPMNWREVVVNVGGVVALNLLVARLTGMFAGPVGLVVSAVLVGSAQLRQAMAKLTTDMRAKLQEQLPAFAREKRVEIKAAIEEAFARFAERVAEAVQGDIDDLRKELEGLIQEKEAAEFDARTAGEQLDRLMDGTPDEPGVRALATEARRVAEEFSVG